MQTIWKFQLKIKDRQQVEMPVRSRILSAQIQGNRLCIWAIVNPESYDKTFRTIRIYGTGHPNLELVCLNFIDTVQDGPLVWHVFEEI